jgi:hypothetical protein
MDSVYARTFPNDNEDADSSDREYPNWNSRYFRNRVHRMHDDEIDASSEYSDVSSDVTPMNEITYREHARSNCRPVANEETRRIFNEFYGDPNRLAQAPSGRGWEDTRLIAAGARLSRRQYGLSEDAWNNSSLNPPEPPASGPVPSLAADRRRAARQQRTDQMIDDLEARQEALQEQRDMLVDEERWAAMAVTAEHRTNLNRHRQSGGIDRLQQELTNRVREFSRSDPEAYAEWMGFAGVANQATTSRSRQLQILQWYTGGPRGSVHDPARRVSQDLLRQLRRVEQYWTEEARLQTSLRYAEMEDESRPELSPRRIANDDNAWGFHAEQVFGYEPQAFSNGFADYVPCSGSTQGVLNHLRANWEVREMRLLHASHTEHRELWRQMVRFARSTHPTFNVLNEQFDNLSASAREEHVRPLEIAISGFSDQIYQFLGPRGYNATASVPGRTRDASPFEAIRNRTRMTAIPAPVNIAQLITTLSAAMAASTAGNGATPLAGSEDDEQEESENRDGYIADAENMEEDA